MSDHVMMYRCNFASFVDFAFRELHPGEQMQDNWHIRLIANILQFTWSNSDSETARRLIFNLPPGYLKTHICSIAFPAWVLGRDPRKSVLIISETLDQALEIRERCAELMSTPRYRKIFPRCRISGARRDLELSYGGRIRHVGVGYSLPQRRSDLVVIDNPQSLHNLERIDPACFVEIGRTLKDPKRGVVLLTTRRLAENDLTSFLRALGNWGKLEIPIVARRETPWGFPPDDNHQRMDGEPLHYWYENWDQIEGHIREVGGEAFAWQYMQGAYKPMTTGQRAHYVDGEPAGLMIGSFNPTTVTLEDFAKLRQEYEEKYDPLKVNLPGFPLKPI